MTTIPQIITIAQQKGGAGKTTLAIHITTALLQMGHKVAAFDIDPQASLSHWFAQRVQKFGDDLTGVKLIKTSGWKINSEIISLKNKIDFIIIDSPPHIETDAKAAIRAAHLVVVPMQPNPTDIWATKATVDICEEEGVNYKVLLNRVTPNSKLAEVARKQFNKIFKNTINNRVLFASSIQDGRSATEIQPKSAASNDIKAIIKELLHSLKALNKPHKKAA